MIQYILDYDENVSRNKATEQDEERVARLVDALVGDVVSGASADTVASVAQRAGLGHETVRRLARNPDRRLRTGPSFFVVAAIARARSISLDGLASKVLENAESGPDAPDASGGRRDGRVESEGMADG